MEAFPDLELLIGFSAELGSADEVAGAAEGDETRVAVEVGGSAAGGLEKDGEAMEEPPMIGGELVSGMSKRRSICTSGR